MALEILEVQELEDHVGLAPLGVNPRAVWRRPLAGARHFRPAVQPRFQDLVG